MPLKLKGVWVHTPRANTSPRGFTFSRFGTERFMMSLAAAALLSARFWTSGQQSSVRTQAWSKAGGLLLSIAYCDLDMPVRITF